MNRSPSLSERAWPMERLDMLRRQHADSGPSLATAQAYINGLEFELRRCLRSESVPTGLGVKSDNAQDIRQLSAHVELANARQALREQAEEIAELRGKLRPWVEVEKAKEAAYEDAARICDEMSHPPEGQERWHGTDHEWAAIKLEDAAKAIREKKAKVCHVTRAKV